MQRHLKGLFGLSLLIAVVCVFGGSALFAQTGTTSLRGTVTDKYGATVAGAKVHLTNVAQALERAAETGESGEYEFLALPPGTYSLSVEKEGFRRYEQDKLQLLVNSPASANVS